MVGEGDPTVTPQTGRGARQLPLHLSHGHEKDTQAWGISVMT